MRLAHSDGGTPYGAKWTAVTRLVPSSLECSLSPPTLPPRPGQLVAARVEQIVAHDHVEDRVGRRARIFPGDLVVGAYGNRYATDVYEGYVPKRPQTHLLTAGGLIGTVASVNGSQKLPTELEVVAALVDETGRQLSTEDFALPEPVPCDPSLGTIVVVGSGMNAGKTTTVAGIIRGLARAGIKVGGAKVTGSGSGKDLWSYVDSGAASVLDFLDYGMPSTFGYPVERLIETTHRIRHELAGRGCEAVVLEIADGLLQLETRALVKELVGVVDAVVVATVDALGARAAADMLEPMGLPLRLVSGLLTRAPLAAREAREVLGVPVVSPDELAAGAALDLLAAVPVS